jgi:hypothetical protein
VTITEPNPVINGGAETLTFTLTCTSSASRLSGTSSVKVVQLDTPKSSGGGGALDGLAILFLLGMLGSSRLRRDTPDVDRLRRRPDNSRNSSTEAKTHQPPALHAIGMNLSATVV